ncbi:MAG TPA: hypothetical protein DCE41_34250 [Cytophagales bacterium]|nr:hypothetical protein [Cytophagales bacterium]HAA24115.1 hypothetical protein [Cytophagales bacterium]HAP62802.1 hypothetical protein [Cytophagales bacterium]
MKKLWLLLGILGIGLLGLAEPTLAEGTQEVAEEFVYSTYRSSEPRQPLEIAVLFLDYPSSAFLSQSTVYLHFIYLPTVRRHVHIQQFLI